MTTAGVLRTLALAAFGLTLCLVFLAPCQAGQASTDQVNAELERLWKLELTAADLFEARKWDQAEELYRQVLAGYRRLLGQRHKAVGRVMFNLGLLFSNQNRHELAEPFYRDALDIRQAVLGPDHPGVAAVLVELGFIHRYRREFPLAAECYARARRIMTAELAASDQVSVVYLEAMHKYFLSQKTILYTLDLQQAMDLGRRLEGKPEKADSLERIAATKRRFRGAMHDELQTRNSLSGYLKAADPANYTRLKRYAAVLHGLGVSMLKSGRAQQAQPLLEQAWLLYGTLAGPGRMWSMMVRGDLRQAYLDGGQLCYARLPRLLGAIRQAAVTDNQASEPDALDEFNAGIGEKALRQTLDSLLRKHGPNSSKLIGVYSLLARMCAEQKKLKEAAELAARAAEIQAGKRRPPRPGSGGGQRSDRRTVAEQAPER